MKPLKQIIAEKLNKRIEEPDGAQNLSPELREFIQKEIGTQLQRVVDEVILPEIRKALSESRNLADDNSIPTEPTADRLDQEFPEIIEIKEPAPVRATEEEILPLEETLLEVIEPSAPSVPKWSVTEK